MGERGDKPSAGVIGKAMPFKRLRLRRYSLEKVHFGNAYINREDTSCTKPGTNCTVLSSRQIHIAFLEALLQTGNVHPHSLLVI